MARRPPRCVYCGQTKPRVIVIGGKAHRRCIPKSHPDHPVRRRKAEDAADVRIAKQRLAEIAARPESLVPGVAKVANPDSRPKHPAVGASRDCPEHRRR